MRNEIHIKIKKDKLKANINKNTFAATTTPCINLGGSNLILGEVTGTAYDGGKGKKNADDIASLSTRIIELEKSTLIETGKLSYINYEKIKNYQFVLAQGFKDGLSAPNQYSFIFSPQELKDNNEDIMLVVKAGPDLWEYHLKIKKASDGNVYWWSDYKYSGNDKFFVTRIVGVK